MNPLILYRAGLSIQGQIVLQIVIMLLLALMLVRHRRDALCILLTLACFPRVFDFFGNYIQNAYKVAILISFVLYFYFRTEKKYTRQDKAFFCIFAFFSLQFFLASFLFSQNDVLVVFSHWTRFLEMFLLFFILRDAVFLYSKKHLYSRLFYELMIVQMLICVVKFFLFHFTPIEGLVGSFSILGGSVGALLPVLGFIVLWVYKEGHIGWQDSWFIAGLMFIGFSSYKRAVVFVLPLVVAVFLFFVVRRRPTIKSIFSFILIGVMLYVGVRLMPSFNPEKQVWGSFNLNYALGTADEYQFGEGGFHKYAERSDYQENINTNVRHIGRGGATWGLFSLLKDVDALTDNDFWGYGVSSIYGVDDNSFLLLPFTLLIDRKGSATGVVQNYICTGIIGCLMTILLCFFPFFYCKKKSLRYALIGFAFWEYFFYAGLLFRLPVAMGMLFLTIFYVNDSLYGRAAEN